MYENLCLGFNDNYLKGCSPSWADVSDAIIDLASSYLPVTACRQLCSDAGHTLALVRHRADCSCADVIPADIISSDACSSEAWLVYRTHHVTNEHALQLSAWSESTTRRAYTKPGEDVAFYATHHLLGLQSIFSFTFDDGTTLVTSKVPVYHAFWTAGTHWVVVTTEVGTVGLNTTISVLIEDVDEGQEPSMVAVTSFHERDAKAALHYVFVADEHSTNCTLDYGDGATLNLPTFADFGETEHSSYQYAVCGRYNVVVDCNNTYGQTTENSMFLAREMDTFFSYRMQGTADFNVSMSGWYNFLEVI